MALVSLPGSLGSETTAIPVMSGDPRQFDDYLLEGHRQAGENARLYATSRLSNLGAFLTYLSLLTAALAILFSSLESSTGPVIPAACMALGFLGLLASVLFYALEIRHHRWEFREFAIVASATDPTWTQRGPLGLSANNAPYGIYKASIGFFGLTIVIAAGLLVLRG